MGIPFVKRYPTISYFVISQSLSFHCFECIIRLDPTATANTIVKYPSYINIQKPVLLTTCTLSLCTHTTLHKLIIPISNMKRERDIKLNYTKPPTFSPPTEKSPN